jgi:tetratricopeptide (TPR) repeat protein
MCLSRMWLSWAPMPKIQYRPALRRRNEGVFSKGAVLGIFTEQDKTGMSSRFIASVAVTIFGFSAGAQAANKTLDQAWDEYHYKNFRMAESGFNRVINSRGEATDREKLEARVGAAMVVQYRLPGDDAAKALEMEKAIATVVPTGDTLGALVHLLMGRAWLRLDQPDLAGATREFAWVIDHFPTSISASEAVLDLSTMPVTSPSKPNIENVIASLEKAIETRPADQFLVFYYQVAGRYAMVIEEWERGRAHLMKALEYTLPNPRDLATCLFQVAYVSDKYLHDPKTAVKYYDRMVKEVMTDNRMSFCQQRSEALKKEIK